jgi:hypothetical protein
MGWNELQDIYAIYPVKLTNRSGKAAEIGLHSFNVANAPVLCFQEQGLQGAIGQIHAHQP